MGRKIAYGGCGSTAEVRRLHTDLATSRTSKVSHTGVGNDESRPKESGASAAHVAQCEVPGASFHVLRASYDVLRAGIEVRAATRSERLRAHHVERGAQNSVRRTQNEETSIKPVRPGGRALTEIVRWTVKRGDDIGHEKHQAFHIKAWTVLRHTESDYNELLRRYDDDTLSERAGSKERISG